MKKSFLLAALCSVTAILTAQSDFKPGYVITLQGDTIKGYIDYRGDDFNASHCNYRATPDGDTKEYLPGEIPRYRILDGKVYVSKEITIDGAVKTVFLEMLVEGKANLYAYAPGAFAKRGNLEEIDKVFYIETQERGLQILENSETEKYTDNKTSVAAGSSSPHRYIKQNNEYIACLKITFQDQFQLMNEVEHTGFNQKDLIKITKKYHDLSCPDEACIVYSKGNTGVKNRLVIVVGTQVSRVKLTERNVAAEFEILDNTSYGVVAGLQLESNGNGTYDRFFSRLSLLYTQVEHEDSSIPILLKYQSLNIGLSLNYIYPRYKVKPSIGIGAMFIKSFRNEDSYIRYMPETSVSSRRSFGPIGTVGIYYSFSEKLMCKLQAEYFYDAMQRGDEAMFYAVADNLNVSLGLSIQLGKE